MALAAPALWRAVQEDIVAIRPRPMPLVRHLDLYMFVDADAHVAEVLDETLSQRCVQAPDIQSRGVPAGSHRLLIHLYQMSPPAARVVGTESGVTPLRQALILPVLKHLRVIDPVVNPEPIRSLELFLKKARCAHLEEIVLTTPKGLVSLDNAYSAAFPSIRFTFIHW
ncbi:hypothetical protein C8F04DRAFT_1232231 [Mycena alexandri]|uniref:Uncharacterized protein n=1 Tax=Mycena alexandri TaxID=1745969 RepID=A0AAD6T3Q2_9AGAR|nr:hypothetical protein C8F04DRAFT_1232231 [Mycena alexandri]